MQRAYKSCTLYRLGHSFFLYSAILAFSSLVPTKSQNDRPTIPFSNRRWRALCIVNSIIQNYNKTQNVSANFRCKFHLHKRIWTFCTVPHPRYQQISHLLYLWKKFQSMIIHPAPKPVDFWRNIIIPEQSTNSKTKEYKKKENPKFILPIEDKF